MSEIPKQRREAKILPVPLSQDQSGLDLYQTRYKIEVGTDVTGEDLVNTLAYMYPPELNEGLSGGGLWGLIEHGISKTFLAGRTLTITAEQSEKGPVTTNPQLTLSSEPSMGDVYEFLLENYPIDNHVRGLGHIASNLVDAGLFDGEAIGVIVVDHVTAGMPLTTHKQAS